MLRKSHELKWFCKCCSSDPPADVARNGRSYSKERRQNKRKAKRREERRWIKEFRQEKNQ